MIDTTNCSIVQVSAHQVGNKVNEEKITLSNEPLNIEDQQIRQLLLKYFTSNFKSPEVYSFTFSNGDFELNPVFKFVSEIFSNKKLFHKQSINLAKLLYENSSHPNIKSGDFYVTYFSSIQIGNEQTDAIGLFKSETKDSFFKLVVRGENFSLKYDDGISLDKLDKGALVFNLNPESGYQVCILDKSNKSIEAQYWREDFLKLRPRENDYHHTKNYLNVARSFVTEKMSEDFDATKVEQSSYLNRSIDYFKKNEQFDEGIFLKEVFEDREVINSFKKFKSNFEDENSVGMADDFLISNSAVKKQARVFKSVLKLDKNFHIYIHGDKGMIEQGVDRDGRKYYKIYYKEEL